METLEERFIDLWDAGTKISKIESELGLDSGQVSYLRRKLKASPRRDLEAQMILRAEVWEMVLRRVPIQTIAEEKKVTETYVRQTVNKQGYSIRDFYDKPKRAKKEISHEAKKGVRCLPNVMHKCIYGTHDCCMYCVIERHSRPCPPEECTCFKRRPKGFKQRSWTFT